MIVTLVRPVNKNNTDYAYACEFGRPYFVYAILELQGGKDQSYMINVWGRGTNNTIYDIPAHYFKVLDKSIPQGWESDSYSVYGQDIHIKSFPEMAHDMYFYDKLMNDDPDTVRIFKRYAKMYEKIAEDFVAS